MHRHHDLCHVTIMIKEYCCGNAAGHFILAAHISHWKWRASVEQEQLYEENKTELTVCVWRTRVLSIAHSVQWKWAGCRILEVQHALSFSANPPLFVCLFVFSPQMMGWWAPSLLMPPMHGNLGNSRNENNLRVKYWFEWTGSCFHPRSRILAEPVSIRNSPE